MVGIVSGHTSKKRFDEDNDDNALRVITIVGCSGRLQGPLLYCDRNSPSTPASHSPTPAARPIPPTDACWPTYEPPVHQATAASTASSICLSPHLVLLQAALEQRTLAFEQRAQRLQTPPIKTSKRGRKPLQLVNPLFGVAELRQYPPWADDILQGIARLNWYRNGARSIPLSVKQLIRILVSIPVIDTRAITQLLLLEERQARRYLKATELALPHLIRSMPPGLNQQNASNDDSVDNEAEAPVTPLYP